MRNRFFFFLDALLLPLATYVAFVVRFEGADWPREYDAVFLGFLLCTYPIKLILLYGMGMYRRLWRYASIADLEHTIAACVLSSAIAAILGAVVLPVAALVPTRVPLAVLLIDAGLTTMFVTGSRLLARARATRAKRFRRTGERRALIVGAGDAGGLIVRELLHNAQLGLQAVGFLDDDPTKHGLRIHNVPVLGAIADIARIARELAVCDVIVALPSAPGALIRRIVSDAAEAGLTTRTVPGLFELVSGRKSVSALRKVEIQDLLRREPISTDLDQVSELVTGHTVLVTGAGGSIGSELCRQLARLSPSCIVAVGRGENSIFELLQLMHTEFPGLRIDPVIVDIRDQRRLQRVFERYRPHSVFHAAAHKHVPLMEANVGEAILNNVMGTNNVVSSSVSVGVEHFVLVSTDKAVRPTSVMGATKRVAEYIVHRAAMDHPGYVSVRFGNVLGSRGSVVPTFLRQIEAGGPVTITHADMTRYFMTIPEAVQLVLQAAALRAQGDVFVLDMGNPVRVQDLAEDMIRLSGLEVGSDIEIRYSGVRPGEKLYEELFFDSGTAVRTSHEKILCVREQVFPKGYTAKVDDLIKAAATARPAREVRRMLASLVPEYVPGVDLETPQPEIIPAEREVSIPRAPLSAEVSAGD
ncbi:MAG: nucleoside-diphosphate sugar epimerase/dehydratase [Gemmatimonadaceae bacterium]